MTAKPHRSLRWLLALLVAAVGVCTPALGRSLSGDPTVGAAGLGDPYYPDDGNGGFLVTHYDLALSYDPPIRHLAGTARLSAVALQLLRQFDLDFSGPPVAMVAVNGVPATFDRTDDHKLVIATASLLLPGQPFTVTVDYAGPVADTPSEGWTIAADGGAFVAGEPHAAASWYPLNDTLTDKATFAVQVSVPMQWEVVSNGVRTRDDTEDGWRTVQWQLHSPTLGYLTTVAIDHFDVVTDQRANGAPIFTAIAADAPHRPELVQQLPDVLDFLESLYGSYPFESAGGIFVDTAVPLSLETQTRPVYASWATMNTVVHENTHQWWGDAMTLRQWSDICLNECFASYTADYLWPERTEHLDVDAKYRADVAAVRTDPAWWAVPLQNPGAGQEFTSVYDRGPMFLHALRRLVGDSVFFPALSQFVQAHHFSTASMPEFRQFMQARTGIDLREFFVAWLDDRVVPPREYLFPGSL